MPTVAAPTEKTWRWPPPTPVANGLAEARSREGEAFRSFRLTLARAEETCAAAARLLADLDHRVDAARARLRQEGYLRG